ncbi:patatin-like phospholipase family protein [Iamia sp. SCSIO 61187]|uniref:patatin-like phospholipase family protein n=1 Tax=Iamia sp. SCSIO 61187 TaxID=2722752 RepID=UPI001C637C44|nr:patatin-like phospholipase family protein [Iamia sp. SCSIO 61187]QYG94906.1 patatin-like phospholipase family protein [Iamia sp. SCSIO 61187]
MSPRVGLVLGAGGLVGQAYQAGVLAALEHDLDWDPRTADVIVGSSAGSITATLLRLGVPATDLAAFAVEAPLSVEGALLSVLGDAPPDLAPFAVRDLVRPWHVPSPALVARSLRRPWAFRPTVAALTLLPAGRVDIEGEAEALATATDGQPWPDGLWIATVRRRDGARVVFGRPGAPPASLPKAVTASCSIPGYFRPVRIDGAEHVDGGVHSSTNADVLRAEGLDLVVVVASMSVAGGWAPTPDAVVRRAVHRRLEREVARLRRRGTEVVRVEPSARVLRAMGVNAMADDRAEDVVREAFLDTGRRTADPRVAARLAVLADRASQRDHAVSALAS